ncbi:hypothetical protein [uncultured Tateyamaria sp.]|uniref:hypothetical protein n=1 Tax=uncultured Tateyamaria sp. TaxID=455651 RepID=UPI002616B7D0|nr:hypothetical protein [uncultured Tateyamaria sp.]
MAYITHTAPKSIAGLLSSLRDGITRALSALGHSVTLSAAAETRFRRIEALNAKTDAELAAMNLRRADIPAFVFRDLMHI